MSDDKHLKLLDGQITDTRREVGDRQLPAGDGRTVVLRRTYDAPVEDVWDAITDPARIARWFMPVSGDLRLGGTYQLQGNAGGEIRRCEPPRLLQVTWIYGENPSEKDVSEVEVRLSADPGGGTLLELEHAAVVDPGMWSQFGPGAVGVGWDLGLLGLAMHLDGRDIPAEEKEAWVQTPEARDFAARASVAWGAALAATGVPEAEVASMVANTTAFYAPSEGADGGGGTAA